MTLDEKRSRLGAILRGHGKACVAFSGGMDSSLLCAIACEELGEGALAITIVSPMLPKSELDDARKVAALVGIRHILVDTSDIEDDVAANPEDRCYFCKKREFGTIGRVASDNGIATVLDGTNVDDEHDYRPGMRAIAELGISSPLREAGLGKQDIRELSRRLGLPTSDKPAFACLASRIPYGERIDAAKLARIEKAEDYLRSLGLGNSASAVMETLPASKSIHPRGRSFSPRNGSTRWPLPLNPSASSIPAWTWRGIVGGVSISRSAR